MPLHASSYFAGVATVVVTTALGFGGGALMTDAFVGKSEKPPTLMERRASPLAESSIATAPAPAEPTVAAQSTAPQVPAPPQVATLPAPAGTTQLPASQPELAPIPATPQPQTQDNAGSPLQASPPAPAAQQLPRQPEQAMAKAQDQDVKKAVAAERRKAERRKWAERRRHEMRKLEELNAVADKVREVEREPVRSFVAESPRIRLLDDD